MEKKISEPLPPLSGICIVDDSKSRGKYKTDQVDTDKTGGFRFLGILSHGLIFSGWALWG